MSDGRWREFYGQEALGYDDVRYGSRYGITFREAHRRAFQVVIRDAGVSGGVALDVASGTGQLVPCVAGLSQILVAADLTPEMLAVSRSQYPYDNVLFTQMNAFQTPFQSGAFNLVVSSRFLHLFAREDQLRLLKEMARICGPGGVVAVDIYNRLPRQMLSPALKLYRFLRRKREEHDHYSSPAEARDLFHEAGLKIELERGVGSYGIGLFLWLPHALRLRLMNSRFFTNRFLAEQWILVGRPAA